MLIETAMMITDGTTIAMKEFIACGVCRTSHKLFVNRAGRTRCISCDTDHQISTITKENDQ